MASPLHLHLLRMFCSVLQCVAVCCSVLQCVAMCCTRCAAMATSRIHIRHVYNVVCQLLLQCVAVCCSVLHPLRGDGDFTYPHQARI